MFLEEAEVVRKVITYNDESHLAAITNTVAQLNLVLLSVVMFVIGLLQLTRTMR